MKDLPLAGSTAPKPLFEEMGLPPATYFLLRRLHSLAGVVPIGAFLLAHLYTNAYSWRPKAFNAHVKDLNELPGILLIEWFTVILPIAFHGILGLFMTSRMEFNQPRYGNFRNWMYVLQRVTGAIVFLFILFHLVQFRFGMAERFKDTELPRYAPWDAIHDVLRGVWVPVYVLGIVCTSFHFANGLWSFAVTWGLARGERTQRTLTAITLSIFVALSAFGLYALGGFLTAAAGSGPP